MDSNGNYFMVIGNEIRYALIFASFYVLLNLKDIRYFVVQDRLYMEWSKFCYSSKS